MKPDFINSDFRFLTSDQHSESDARVQWCLDNIATIYNSEESICKIDENNKLIIYGDILIPDEYEELPIKIDEVYGNVIVGNTINHVNGYLKSLKNFPTKIHGKFDCRMNPNLKTLENGPEWVGGSYWCNGCSLKNFNGIAKYIGGSLLAFANDIEDLSALRNCNIKHQLTLSSNVAINDPYRIVLQRLNKIAE